MIVRKTHYLKIKGEYYLQIVAGSKTWELRNNDKDYKLFDDILFTDSQGELYDGQRYEIVGITPCEEIMGIYYPDDLWGVQTAMKYKNLVLLSIRKESNND